VNQDRKVALVGVSLCQLVELVPPELRREEVGDPLAGGGARPRPVPLSAHAAMRHARRGQGAKAARRIGSIAIRTAPGAPGKGSGCCKEAFDVRVCVPITTEGQVDPRWGRADRVAVADVVEGEIAGWQEFTVAWGTLHDEGTEGAHHARVARFLRDNQVQAIAVRHVGPGMQRMLGSMAIRVVDGLGGDARSAARAAG
jgi:predicted Fe-Mo cluster-binding NifX family protein